METVTGYRESGTGRIEYNEMMFDMELCKGCYLCVSFCPNQIIVISDKLNHKGYRPVAFAEKEGNGCTGCGVCSNICPDFAIRVAA